MGPKRKKKSPAEARTQTISAIDSSAEKGVGSASVAESCSPLLFEKKDCSR